MTTSTRYAALCKSGAVWTEHIETSGRCCHLWRPGGPRRLCGG
nr:MAG TPA: hypothetical protein [Caudoviricetes sp.]DAJ93541.1 MAG TPA: hypothetical protein [Caudoviricetes sp.]